MIRKRVTLCCDEPDCRTMHTVEVEPAEVGGRLDVELSARASAAEVGWSTIITATRLRDRCPDHDVVPVGWHVASSRTVIRGRYPWARSPHATIRGHLADFTVYDGQGEGTLVVREEAEPHQAIRWMLLPHTSVEAATVRAATWAATERAAPHHAPIGG